MSSLMIFKKFLAVVLIAFLKQARFVKDVAQWKMLQLPEMVFLMEQKNLQGVALNFAHVVAKVQFYLRLENQQKNNLIQLWGAAEGVVIRLEIFVSVAVQKKLFKELALMQKL